jgi:hypothetical protein
MIGRPASSHRWISSNDKQLPLARECILVAVASKFQQPWLRIINKKRPGGGTVPGSSQVSARRVRNFVSRWASGKGPRAAARAQVCLIDLIVQYTMHGSMLDEGLSVL